MRRETSQAENQTQRIEAFSDGVFAIAITLLVLEIRPPALGLSGQHIRLASALARDWPSYVAYAFSFLMIGIYWANHHYLWRLYKRVDHWFLLLNLLFLMCISFLPYASEILSRYVMDSSTFPDAVRFYELGLVLPAIAWFLTWKYASHNNRLIDRNLRPEFVTKLSWLYFVSILIYGAALAVSYINAMAGLVIALTLTLSYLLPPKEPKYRD
jgi:uncharacterized membrane protein